jgi:hypothetical protein
MPSGLDHLSRETRAVWHTDTVAEGECPAAPGTIGPPGAGQRGLELTLAVDAYQVLKELPEYQPLVCAGGNRGPGEINRLGNGKGNGVQPLGRVRHQAALVCQMRSRSRGWGLGGATSERKKECAA